MSFISNPASAQSMVLLESQFAPPGVFGAFFVLTTFSAIYSSYLIRGTQLQCGVDGPLRLAFGYDAGVYNNVLCSSSHSQFDVASVETIVASAPGSPSPISDTWNSASSAGASFTIYLDNILKSPNNGWFPCFSGIVAVPKTLPVNCTLTDKFSGSINSITAGKTINTLKIDIGGGTIGGGTVELFGLR